MKYKMNQNAIDELARIHKRFKLLEMTMPFLIQYIDPEMKAYLKMTKGWDVDEMDRLELYTHEDQIRDIIRFHTMGEFDWFRCDVDENCCNRKEYEPLEVEVIA